MKVRLCKINPNGESQASSWEKLRVALCRFRDSSRTFTFDLIAEMQHGLRSKYVGCMDISKIRLRKSKHYCGSHAGPCQINGGSHRKSRHLEGGDWVRFNDKINDILDSVAGGLSAEVKSHAIVLRKGTKRRTAYRGAIIRQGEWNNHGLDEDFEDFCGKKARRSLAEAGTPALPSSQYLS